MKSIILTCTAMALIGLSVTSGFATEVEGTKFTKEYLAEGKT
jgi:hypothetical protein